MRPDLGTAGGTLLIPGFHRVQLLLAQMALVLCANVLLLLVHLPWSVALLAAACAALIAVEWRCGVSNLFSRALLVASVVALTIDRLYLSVLELPQLLLIFNGMLLMASLWQLFGPGTASPGLGAGKGSPSLLRRTALVWLTVNALGTSILLTLLTAGQDGLLPLVYLLPLLPLSGVVLTLWIHFMSTGDAHIGASFTTGAYRFERLRAAAPDLIPFYRQFMREALPSIRQGSGPALEGLDAWVDLKMSLDRESWPHTQFFVARHGDEIVGTISCALKLRAHRLGFENGHSQPLSVQPLCRYGRVLEVGRLSVASGHRFGRDVLQGLMRCVMEQAFRLDAAFLVTQSYLAACPVYRKIGFFEIDKSVAHQIGLGVEVVPMAFNLAARVVCEATQANASDAISDALVPYCAERYFKRQALRSLFFGACAWKLTPADIIALLRPESTDASGQQEVRAHAG